MLSNTLGKNSNAFIKSIHKVINEYLRTGAKDFQKNIIVFDEGQRAWDKKQMSTKKNIPYSEPDILIEMAEKRLDWSVLLILVGEGQEIYKGESSDLTQWNRAIERTDKKWEVICPEKLTTIFKNSNNVIKNDNFNLDVSLRTHLASEVSQFVNLLLNGNIKEAKELAPLILNSGFNMYVTQHFGRAKEYCLERYENNTKCYGLITSSKALKKRDSDIKEVEWFNENVSYKLERPISEFKCQGLEIDMPIIGWGNDMIWNKKERKWEKFDKNDKQNSLYRINSYRVLLTRGRDGFIVCVSRDLTSVYEVLVEAGMEIL